MCEHAPFCCWHISGVVWRLNPASESDRFCSQITAALVLLSACCGDACSTNQISSHLPLLPELSSGFSFLGAIHVLPTRYMFAPRSNIDQTKHENKKTQWKFQLQSENRERSSLKTNYQKQTETNNLLPPPPPPPPMWRRHPAAINRRKYETRKRTTSTERGWNFTVRPKMRNDIIKRFY